MGKHLDKYISSQLWELSRKAREYSLQKGWGHIGSIVITPERQDRRIVTMRLRTVFGETCNREIDKFVAEQLKEFNPDAKLVCV